MVKASGKSALGRYAKKQEARRKAAIAGVGGLTGDIVGLIPGIPGGPQIGAGIKKAAGHLSGDKELAATPIPQKKKKDREREVDTILDGIKKRRSAAVKDKKEEEDDKSWIVEGDL